MEPNELRHLLLSKQNELLERREKIHQDFASRHTNSGHNPQSNRHDNDDVLTALDREAEDELRQIKEALQRLDNNDFQHCRQCGKIISDERLLTIPYTCYCRDCANHPTN